MMLKVAVCNRTSWFGFPMGYNRWFVTFQAFLFLPHLPPRAGLVPAPTGLLMVITVVTAPGGWPTGGLKSVTPYRLTWVMLTPGNTGCSRVKNHKPALLYGLIQVGRGMYVLLRVFSLTEA